MMRLLIVVGILLILFGVFSLGTQGITFFTQEKVADIGPVQVTAEKPYTIFWHPATGAVALAVGLALVGLGAVSSRGRA